MISGIGNVERDRHSGFVESGPERIEIGIRRRAAECGTGAKVHQTRAGGQDAVELTTGLVEIEE